jgi:hypothetical protein
MAGICSSKSLSTCIDEDLVSRQPCGQLVRQKRVPGFDLFWAIDVNVVQIESDIERCAQSLDVENESIQARIIDYWILKFHVSCVFGTGYLLKITAT